jgi:integrase
LSAWDKELDFDATRKMLAEKYAEVKSEVAARGGKDRRPFFIAVLLTQLTNGGRISESYEAMKRWLEGGDRTLEVRLRKRGKLLVCESCKLAWKKRGTKGREAAAKHVAQTGHMLVEKLDIQMRRMEIPPEVLDLDREPLFEITDAHATAEAARKYASLKLGFNTHSLRYSWRTKAEDLGISSAVGRRITGHTSQDQYDGYLSQRKANEALKKMVEETEPS